MRIIFDLIKNEKNSRERNLPFELVAMFDFDHALFSLDERKEYGETRFIALGLLKDRPHVLCFAETSDGIRVISFRKANSREVKRYDSA